MKPERARVGPIQIDHDFPGLSFRAAVHLHAARLERMKAIRDVEGLLNVGVPLGTEARAGVSDTADATTKINPTMSGAVLRTSRNPVITPPSERQRSAKSTTMKAVSRPFVADEGPLAIIAIHENRPGTPPSSLASTEQTGAHRRAFARARAGPAIPRRGRVRQWIRRAPDVAAPAPHDHHNAPDGRRLDAHVVA